MIATASAEGKTIREIGSAAGSFARARWMLRNTNRGKNVRCYGRVLVEGRAGVVVSDRVVFMKGMLPSELRCAEGAELVIGTRTMFNYGVSIVAQRSIRIGDGCQFGSLVEIRDDDGRRTAPVVIGDGVWVAHGALIEPGAVVGDGSVIAAGAVVSAPVPPRMLAFGNPARIFPLEGTEVSVMSADDEPPNVSTGERVRRIDPSSSRGRDLERAANVAQGPAGTSREEVRAVIIEWLDDTRHFGEAASLVTSDDVSLREGGLLDSLGLVELVLMLEERFGPPIDKDLAARPDHQSMNAFIDLVAKRRSS